jgi:undecaprenyl-diphosphatase
MKNISIGLVILAIFMVLGYALSNDMYHLQALNEYFFNLFRETRSADGVAVMKILTRFGEGVILFPLTGTVLLSFFVLRKWKMGMIFAIGAWMMELLTNYSKILFNIQRPTDQLIGTGGYSYPSGHVTAVALVFGMIMVGLVPLMKRYRKLQILSYALCGLIVTLVCISRLYLNAHWFTDVVGGVLLPLGCIFLLVGLGEKIENARP